MCAILELFFAFFFLSLSGCVHSIVICSLCFRNSHRRKRLSGIIFFFFFTFRHCLYLIYCGWYFDVCSPARITAAVRWSLSSRQRWTVSVAVAFFFFFCKLFRVYVLSAPWVWSLLTPCLSVAQTHSQLTNYVKRNKTRKKWQCCRRFALVYERMCLIYYPYLLRAAQPVVVVDISIWHSAVSLNFFCTCW